MKSKVDEKKSDYDSLLKVAQKRKLKYTCPVDKQTDLKQRLFQLECGSPHGTNHYVLSLLRGINIIFPIEQANMSSTFKGRHQILLSDDGRIELLIWWNGVGNQVIIN